jgi:integrase
MTTALAPSPNQQLTIAGHAANEQAARAVFVDYRSRRADNTIRRQDADLALFAEYLNDAGVTAGNFSEDPRAWRGVTWGLVEGFVKWQLIRGYAVASVNVRLSTVKGYASLAHKAGQLDPTEAALISTVRGYKHAEVRHIDDKRRADDIPTRQGHKKAQPTSITTAQAEYLMVQASSRDTLLMCLLLEHGLRVGEVVMLEAGHFDLPSRTMTFYREKVDKKQTHRLTDRTLQAAIAHLEHANGRLFPITARAINKRVGYLGKGIGIERLSPHDLRHHWATQAARNGTPIKALQDAGGWNSPSMPLHYIESAQIANEGVLS